MATFGANLREWRIRRGLTQAELGRLSEIGRDSISHMENGNHFPKPGNVRALASALEIETNDLFDGPASPKVPPPSSPELRSAGKAGDEETPIPFDHLWDAYQRHQLMAGDLTSLTPDVRQVLAEAIFGVIMELRRHHLEEGGVEAQRLDWIYTQLLVQVLASIPAEEAAVADIRDYLAGRKSA